MLLWLTFGLPISHEDDEDRGVKAGINMITRLWEWSIIRREKDGKPPALDMGLGLNTDKIACRKYWLSKANGLHPMIGDGVNLAD